MLIGGELWAYKLLKLYANQWLLLRWVTGVSEDSNATRAEQIKYVLTSEYSSDPWMQLGFYKNISR